MQIISCLLYIIIFYGLCIGALCCDGGYAMIKKVYTEFTLKLKIIILAILAFAVLFIIYWVEQDQFIYFWDYAGYWTYSVSRMNYIFDSSFGDILTTLIQSINNHEYNVFLPTIIALPMKLFGYTFRKYVFITGMMFLMPTFFVQGMIATKIVRKSKLSIGKVSENFS